MFKSFLDKGYMDYCVEICVSLTFLNQYGHILQILTFVRNFKLSVKKIHLRLNISVFQYSVGPWPSQDRVLIFKHKPPEPEFVGSKPIGPVFTVVLGGLNQCE